MAIDDSNKKQKCILLLSAPIGSGHIQAANAIKEELLKRENTKVVIGNIFDFCPKIFGETLLSSYLLLLKIFPKGYDFLYQWGDKSNSLSFRYFVNWLFTFGAYKFINKLKPDVVIATHVTPAGIIAMYKRKYNVSMPLFGVVTDYSMHQWWLYNEINAYVIADKSIFVNYNNCLKSNQEVWDFGIPVHEQFIDSSKSKEALRKPLNLPEKAFICLLSGGGEGLLPMDKIVNAWQSYHNKIDNIYFIAVCGRNKHLKNKLTKLNLPYVKILDYIDDVEKYMKASDLLISKAGGVTITEAIVANLPALLFSPLPGQELINTKYLLENNLVSMAYNTTEICDKLHTFATTDSAELSFIKEQQSIKAKPLATKNIIKQIYQYMNW